MQRDLTRRLPFLLKYSGNAFDFWSQGRKTSGKRVTTERSLQVPGSSALSLCLHPTSKGTRFPAACSFHRTFKPKGELIPRRRQSVSFAAPAKSFCLLETEINSSLSLAFRTFSLPVLFYEAMMEHNGTKHVSEIKTITEREAMRSSKYELSVDSYAVSVTVNHKDMPANQDSTPSITGNRTEVPFQLQKCEDDILPEKKPIVRDALVGENGNKTERFADSQTKSQEVSDEDSFGLVRLFDEDLQCKEADRWRGQMKGKQKKRERRTRKRKLGSISNEGDEAITSVSAEQSDSSKERKRTKRVVPNYFVAIRVSKPGIHSGIKAVQDAVIRHDEKLKPALIPLVTLHLTLMVMHLEGEEQIQKAKDVLTCCKEKLMPVLQEKPLFLTFCGLGHFRQQVLFSKVSGQEEEMLLRKVASIVRETFASKEIPSTDPREFEPHLTVIKLSRKPVLRKKGIKKIPEEAYLSFIDTNFGKEGVNTLHLCSMNQKEKDGFYKCLASVKLDTHDDQLPPGSIGTDLDSGQSKCSVSSPQEMEPQAGLSQENATSTEHENTASPLLESITVPANQTTDRSTQESHTDDKSWDLVIWSDEEKAEYEMHRRYMVCKQGHRNVQKRKCCMLM